MIRKYVCGLLTNCTVLVKVGKVAYVPNPGGCLVAVVD